MSVLTTVISVYGSESGAMVASSASDWHTPVLTGAVAGVVAALTLSVGRWVIKNTFIKHDLSALAYLGEDKDVEYLANAPIYPDSPRYYTIGSEIYANNDPRDILGFVVGQIRRLESPPHGAKPGYYAYVVINWESSEAFKKWVNRGFGIQVAAPYTENGDIDPRRSDNRHLVLAPFSEDDKRVVDICDGPRAHLRWHPYAKYGFEATDIDNRALSWQTKVLIRLGRQFQWAARMTQRIFRSRKHRG